MAGLCSFKCKYYIHTVHAMYINQRHISLLHKIYYITYHVSLTLVWF